MTMEREPAPPPANVVALFLGYTPRPLELFPALLIAGLLSRLNEYGKDLLVYGQFHRQPQDDLCEALLDHRIDGLVFIPPIHQPVACALAQPGLPVVAVADRAPGIVSVTVDNETGAFMLAEHLALRGHRRIAFRKDPFEHESAVQRLEAFRNSAEYLGIEVLVTTPANEAGGLAREEETLLLDRSARRPTAVVTWADSFTYPVLRFCRQRGLQVPGDVAVAGFDGIPTPVEPARRLTTIQAPWYQAAEKAADLLMQIARGEDVLRETVLPVDLVIGDTT
jgi:DNA-binding LacI/PurR family transcriptional regulator